MTRFKFTLEYNGSDFVGWQRQENGLAVAELLERAAAAFSGCAGNASQTAANKNFFWSLSK